MAISVSIKKFNGHEYVYIVDGFRDPLTRRPTSRTLVSFGRKDKLLAGDPDAMKKVEETCQRLRKDSSAYSDTIKDRLLTGAHVDESAYERPASLTCTPAVFYPIWKQLGMEAYFNNYRHNHKLAYDLAKTVFFGCVSRLIAPSSKSSAWRYRQSFIIDFEDIELQRLYDCLDILSDQKDKITTKLNKSIDAMYQRDLTIAMYDVSTFYFESFTEDDLRRRGMSKEHRTQETQVVLGLLIDSEGIPFAYELFPGNTAEVHTLLKVVNKFRKQYKIKDVIVVADSGLNQLVNLNQLQELNLKFIVGYPPYVKLSKAKQDELLNEADWNWHTSPCGDKWGHKSLALEIDKKIVNSATGEKKAVKLSATCIGTFSTHRYHHDLNELNLKWNKAEQLVSKGKEAVAAASKSGFKALIKVSTKSATLNNDLYEKRLRWCGYGALLTNIEGQKPEWIYHKLRQLWRIEDNFRMLKTNLQARPVFVWTQEHIRGHFVLNYIALVMQKILLRHLNNQGVHVSAAELVEALESMKVNRLQGMKKANSNLYSCSNTQALSTSMTDAGGNPITLRELCDRILKACGMEPLNSLESAPSIKRKLKVQLPIQ